MISLPTHLGGKVVSPDFEDKWDGYTGNERVEHNAKTYSERFAVTVPSLEQAQQAVDITYNHDYEIAIPNEELTLMV